MRRHQPQQLNDADLQADVMRFLAIVAFCLIAILAMVRNVTAPTPASSATPETAESDPQVPVVSQTVQLQPPVLTDPPAESIPANVLPAPKIESPAEESLAEESPIESSTKQPRSEVPVAEKPPLKPPIDVAVSTADTHAETPEPAAEHLTLRFSSQSDFLRLVAKGRVSVHAFDAQQFLTMDQQYRFSAGPRPQQVFEMQASTIPNPLRQALGPKRNADDLTWAVALPPRVQNQIQDFVARKSNGTLLINRYEEVSYQARP